MTAPDIRALAPRYGAQGLTGDPRGRRDGKKFQQTLDGEREAEADPEPETEAEPRPDRRPGTAVRTELQRRARGSRKDTQDGERHVDVLA